MMPAIRPPSITSRAPIRFSPSLRTASNTEASAAMVSTSLPLPRSTDAIVMATPFGTRVLARLIVPLRVAKGNPVPHQDPLPSPRYSTMRRFWRILRLLALLSIVMAAIAVVLVARGVPTIHIHMLIATALGIGLTVLLGTVDDARIPELVEWSRRPGIVF